MAHYFITGASAGIGAALVTQVLLAVHIVSAVARRAERLRDLGVDFSDQSCALPADVSDTDAMHSAVESACSALGPIEVAILNAGIYTPQNALDIDPRDYQRHMDINYMGVVNALPGVIASMRAAAEGLPLRCARSVRRRGDVLQLREQSAPPATLSQPTVATARPLN